MIAAFLLFLLAACAGNVDRGEAALAADDLLAAEDAFRAALDANPDDPDALYGLGWTFHLAGEEDAALDAFARLSRLHPSRADGYRGVASVLLGRGDLPGARAQLVLAESAAADDAALMQSWVILELASGDAAAALARADAGIARHPDVSPLLQARSAALLTAGKPAEAREAAERAVAVAEPGRELVAAWITWVDAVLRESDGRLDPENCAATSAPVVAWLDAADDVLDRAEAAGVHRSKVVEARRQVRRRRAFVEDACSGVGK